jgi:hypothetical protein
MSVSGVTTRILLNDTPLRYRDHLAEQPCGFVPDRSQSSVSRASIVQYSRHGGVQGEFVMNRRILLHASTG